MDYFGINSAEELPKIKEVIPEEIVNPTSMSGSGQEAEQETLAVTEGGELIIDDSIESEES